MMERIALLRSGDARMLAVRSARRLPVSRTVHRSAAFLICYIVARKRSVL